ncbi:uncharacterized protein BXZ73DRAFT_99167 [Epithele typhae]|uniref:uncharacterized protein n=1 Tax=Epithele typhae TaxID=378194 RepID=UPI002008B07D|nr:uncharacterized protein BXZ73DRAFT_99167 [Epithele typhae]KAH9940168.1 hypothetical protein BXZ73DRAFT_99167 [Epithele typhae]
MSAEVLPREVQDHIIDSVNIVAPGALLECSRVSRAWHIHSQHHLYSSVTIRDVRSGPSTSNKHAFLNTLALNPLLASRVLSLELLWNGWGSVIDAELTWLALLVNLRSLTLVSHPTMHPISIESLCRILLCLPSLESLTLQDTVVSDSVFREHHLYYSYIDGTHLFFTVLKQFAFISMKGLKTVDIPRLLPWGNPHASRAVLSSIDTSRLERFGVFIAEYNQGLMPASLQMRNMLQGISGFTSLRHLDISYMNLSCYKHAYLTAANLSLQPFLIDALHEHFALAPALHPDMAKITLRVLYPIVALVEPWTPAVARLAATLCNRAKYPRFRHLHLQSVVRKCSTGWPWDASLEETREIGLRLFSAFEEKGVEVEVEAKAFWLEGRA